MDEGLVPLTTGSRGAEFASGLDLLPETPLGLFLETTGLVLLGDVVLVEAGRLCLFGRGLLAAGTGLLEETDPLLGFRSAARTEDRWDDGRAVLASPREEPAKIELTAGPALTEDVQAGREEVLLVLF